MHTLMENPMPQSMSRPSLVRTFPVRPLRAMAVALTVLAAPHATEAQSASSPAKSARPGSIAIEADALAYGIKGTSGILSMSFGNGLQVAAGAGNYEVPTFLLEGDKNYDLAHWRARATSVQVVRATYRLNGPMKNGLALGAVVLNQRWRLSAERLSGSTTFQPLSAGLTAGYYLHLGRHFYIYPTTAFTYNRVVSGKAELQGTAYKVNRFAPNASLHIGWEMSR
jgi:hypothetical protein